MNETIYVMFLLKKAIILFQLEKIKESNEVLDEAED